MTFTKPIKNNQYIPHRSGAHIVDGADEERQGAVQAVQELGPAVQTHHTWPSVIVWAIKKSEIKTTVTEKDIRVVR